MRKQILAILFLTLLISCSKKQEKTDVGLVVKIGGLSSLGTASSGGAMLYGKSNNGYSFAKRLDNVEGNSLSLNLENGIWDFHAFAWDGTDSAGVLVSDLVGVARCGASLGNILTGGEVAIDISLRNSACHNPLYAGATNSFISPNLKQTFPNLKISSCKTLGVATSAAADCDQKKSGYISSFRVYLQEFEIDETGFFSGGLSEGLVGPCYGVLTSSTSEMSSIVGSNATLNIPFGSNSANLPFRTVVRAYYGSETCDDLEERGFSEAIYDRGLSEPDTKKNQFLYVEGTTATVKAFFETSETTTCEFPRNLPMSVGKFATGTANSYWHGLCSRSHLDSIGGVNFSLGTPAHYLRNYSLLTKINYFEGWDPSLGDQPPTPSNFPMLGEDITNASYRLNSTDYLGVFDGNGHSIVGLTIDHKGDSNPLAYIGFARKIGPTGEISNLTFLLPDVRGSNHEDHKYIGFVAGDNNGLIENIIIKEGDVRGLDYVGGVTGYNQSAGSILSARLFGTSIEGVARLGGIAGKNEGYINQSKAVGEVKGRKYSGSEGYCENFLDQTSADCESVSPNGAYTWVVSQEFGGITGSSSGTISESMSSGVVSGHFTVGGLVGVTYPGSNIDNSYSLASVIVTGKDENGDAYGGGLIGHVQSSNTIDHSFHIIGNVISLEGALFIGGVFGKMGSLPTIANQVFTTHSNTAVTNLSQSTYAVARIQGTYSSFDFPNIWVKDDVLDFPRLAWEENRDCHEKFGVLTSNGSGTATDPYLICNKTQLLAIKTKFTDSDHYKLMRPINVLGNPSIDKALLFESSNSGAGFAGVLDGNNYSINGLDLSISTSNSDIGLFDKIAAGGIVKNLILIPKEIGHNDGGSTSHIGGIVGVNEGILDNVQVIGEKIYSSLDSGGVGYTGGIAGVNKGVIVGAKSVIKISGEGRMGGIAGHNFGGLILYSEFQREINSTRSSGTAAYNGGIAGKNEPNTGGTFFDRVISSSRSYNGHIIESEAMGIFTADNSPGSFGNTGGIVGENHSIIYDAIGDMRLGLDASQLGALSDFGFCIGHNGTAGNATRLQCHANMNEDPGGVLFNTPGSNTGLAYGSNPSGVFTNSIIVGALNMKGIDHNGVYDSTNNNYMLGRTTSFDFALMQFLENLNFTAGRGITTSSLDYTVSPYDLAAANGINVNSLEETISAIDFNATTVGETTIDLVSMLVAGSYPVYINFQLDTTDALENFLSGSVSDFNLMGANQLGWDLGDDAVWEEVNGNNHMPRLKRKREWEETSFDKPTVYYDLMLSGN